MSWPLFKYDVISDFPFVATAKMPVIRNFIENSLFLNEWSLNLA